MKITDHILQNQGKTRFSFEILPPKKGETIQSVFDGIDPLMPFDPLYINVTYHRQDYKYIEQPGGLLKKVAVSHRPGTVGICAAINNHYEVDAVPHILSGGFTKEETEVHLIDIHFLGLDNVMALRGDAKASEVYFKPEKGGHAYASELVEQISNLNKGKYLYEETEGHAKTNFCIGVAGYPEKHVEAPSLDADLRNLKRKVDNGADYIITQMFFDNQKFFEFERKCREIGIDVPIIPGLKPIVTTRQMTVIPQRFHLDLPELLVERLQAAKTKKEVEDVGVQWCIEQSQELMTHGVPILHYYSMGKGRTIKRVADEVFGR